MTVQAFSMTGLAIDTPRNRGRDQASRGIRVGKRRLVDEIGESLLRPR
jgi:hypothetical protein